MSLSNVCLWRNLTNVSFWDRCNVMQIFRINHSCGARAMCLLPSHLYRIGTGFVHPAARFLLLLLLMAGLSVLGVRFSALCVIKNRSNSYLVG